MSSRGVLGGKVTTMFKHSCLLPPVVRIPLDTFFFLDSVPETTTMSILMIYYSLRSQSEIDRTILVGPKIVITQKENAKREKCEKLKRQQLHIVVFDHVYQLTISQPFSNISTCLAGDGVNPSPYCEAAPGVWILQKVE